MAPRAGDYTYCDSDASLREALTALRYSSTVFLDCEGLDLGTKGGSLSLISFCTTTPISAHTFVIDIVVLNETSLRPLFDLLESTDVTKVVFDGRMDFSALYHEYGVTMQGVIDLQLVDVRSRQQRGEDEDDQLARLSPYLLRSEIFSNRTVYLQVQKLAGLNQCLQEHKVPGTGTKLPVDHGLWLRRPLPGGYLRYAAEDVRLIGLLYGFFKNQRYIDDKLADQSARYVSIWRTNQPPRSTNMFKQHALLPLDILEHHPHRATKICCRCERALSQESFSKTAWRCERDRKCWVCRAISVKDNNRGRGSRYGEFEEDGDDFDFDFDEYEPSSSSGSESGLIFGGLL